MRLPKKAVAKRQRMHALYCELGGIDETASYEVETYGGGVEKVSGAALKRLVIDLPAPRSFKLLFYCLIKN